MNIFIIGEASDVTIASLEKDGYTVHGGIYNKNERDHVHLRRTLPLVCSADAVMLNKGYTTMNKSIIESYLATRLGKATLPPSSLMKDKYVFLNAVISGSAKQAGFTPKLIMSKSRLSALSLLRSALVGNIYNLPIGKGWISFNDIGAMLNRNHSTLVHLMHVYRNEIKVNKRLKDYDAIVKANLETVNRPCQR